MLWWASGSPSPRSARSESISNVRQRSGRLRGLATSRSSHARAGKQEREGDHPAELRSWTLIGPRIPCLSARRFGSGTLLPVSLFPPTLRRKSRKHWGKVCQKCAVTPKPFNRTRVRASFGEWTSAPPISGTPTGMPSRPGGSSVWVRGRSSGPGLCVPSHAGRMVVG
jgi:hypothetical protein